jgi:putative flippase GtrA
MPRGGMLPPYTPHHGLEDSTMTALVPARREPPASPEPRLARRRGSILGVRIAQGRRLLLSARARPVRFAAVGCACGLLQLVLLVALKLAGLPTIPANVAAYLLSAQANFLLSNRFIWHDRWSKQAHLRDLAQRWMGFHLSIAGTFVLSQAVFIAGRLVMPDVIASALGIGVAAVVNFLVQDRLAFRRVG